MEVGPFLNKLNNLLESSLYLIVAVLPGGVSTLSAQQLISI